MMKFKKILVGMVMLAAVSSNANALDMTLLFKGGVPVSDPVTLGAIASATVLGLSLGTGEAKKIGREVNRVHRQIERETKPIRDLFKF